MFKNDRYLTWALAHMKSLCNPIYFLSMEGQETHQTVHISVHPHA